jgi:hypothetical protein
MSAKRFIPTAAATAAVIFFASVVVLAVVTTVSVYPGNLQGWQTQTTPGAQPTPASTPSVTFVFGPSTPPLGRGSAQLGVGSDGSAAAQLRHPGYAGTVLPNPSPDPDSIPAGNELTALSYSTYVQVGGSATQAPYIILDVDYDNNGTRDDQLVFEPQYQIAGFCPSNPQGPVATGVWQTWDAFNGCWYSTGGAAGSGPGANVKTLTAISAAQPNAKIVNSASGDGGVRIVAGFGGVIGGGSASDWASFIGNVDAFTIGVGFDPDTGVNGTTYDFEPKAPPAPTARGVIISELRNSGPGSCTCTALPAPDSSGDEYVELYNTTDQEIAVTSDDGTEGWTLVKRGLSCVDPPVPVALIPNGTVIPARGHYLLAGFDYTLNEYPAGDGSSAAPLKTTAPDALLSDTIGGDVDIALFNTSNPSSFDFAHRLDAVGFNNGSGGTCDLLTEGTPLPNTRDSAQQYAFVRREPLGGGVQDTDNNAADFVEVSTDPTQNVGDNPSPVLGAPGPQNTSSPVNANDVVAVGLTSPSAGQAAPPNRERNPSPDGLCSPLGTLLLRRSVTNNSGAPISRLRFRVIDVTTVNREDESNGGQQAILHVRSSSPETLTGVPGRGDVSVFGLHDEQEIFEDETQCGGLNDSLTVSDGESSDIITLDTPLAPGATIDVVFLLGVEQTGHFRFYVNIEALENSGPSAGPSPGRPASSTKRPIALTGRTAPKTPSTGSKPPSTSSTPVSTPANTPATRPGGTDGTTAQQRKTRPATPSVTPGVWRKLSPDATPETPPDAMPVSRHSRRDPN